MGLWDIVRVQCKLQFFCSSELEIVKQQPLIESNEKKRNQSVRQDLCCEILRRYRCVCCVCSFWVLALDFHARKRARA